MVRALGAADEENTDVTLGATKLVLARSPLLNATLRFTEANELGLLGLSRHPVLALGGCRPKDGRSRRRAHCLVSTEAAMLLSGSYIGPAYGRRWVMGSSNRVLFGKHFLS